MKSLVPGALALALAGPAVLTTSGPVPCQPNVAQPVLSSSLAGEDGSSVSTDGTVALTWQIGDEGESTVDAERITFELEETDPLGERFVIDAGPHLAAALSGRDDGLHRYRVRAVSTHGTVTAWSEPIEVRFEHHPLWLAFLLFGIGAAVFVATASLVLLGHRRVTRARS